jgi:hypothetical protein
MTSGSLTGTASLASNSLLLQGTGSIGFATTASLLEVSSSQQQISSSLLQVSASYISLSGSYTTFSGSASTRITANSSSIQQVSSSQQQISASLLNVVANYATTGSNSFRADQSITGSLVVSSTITAQTLVVQTVTSSIVYSSGSNIFGSALGDRQTFTGSVNITGSLSLNNIAIPTSASLASTYLPLAGGTLTGALSGTSATFSGNLNLQGAVTRNINFYDSSNTNINAQIQYDQIASNSGQLFFGTNNAGTFATRLTISNNGAATFSNSVTMGGDLVLTPTDSAISFSSGAARFFTGGQEKMRITSGNDVGIGATTITNPNSIGRVLELKLANSVGIVLNDSRDASPICLENRGAVFHLTYGTKNLLVSNGASGNVGIGTSAPVTLLQVSGSSTDNLVFVNNTNANGYGSVRCANNGNKAAVFGVGGSSVGAPYADTGYIYTDSGVDLTFSIGGSQKMRITSGGNVGIGITPESDKILYINGGSNTLSVKSAYNTSFGDAISIRNSSSTTMFSVRNDGFVNVGTFTYGNSVSGRPVLVETGGGLGYNASTRESKKNIETINNISWITQLNPVSFNKRKKGEDGNYSEEVCEEVDYGFIADEVEKINSDFVFYNHKEDGTKELAGVKYESMTAILVKAIQEQQVTITSLQAQITELKNK